MVRLQHQITITAGWDQKTDYKRLVQTAYAEPDIAGEMAAGLEAAPIVFRDNGAYSSKLIKGAQTVFAFARDEAKEEHTLVGIFTFFSRHSPPLKVEKE